MDNLMALERKFSVQRNCYISYDVCPLLTIWLRNVQENYNILWIVFYQELKRHRWKLQGI